MSSSPLRVLLIEDSSTDAQLLQEHLSLVDTERFEVTHLERALDAVHCFAKEVERATRRKRKIERDQVIAIVNIVTVLVGIAATAIPQLKVVSNILNGVNNSLPVVLPNKPAEGKI
jgi:hypothetical protein